MRSQTGGKGVREGGRGGESNRQKESEEDKERSVREHAFCSGS